MAGDNMSMSDKPLKGKFKNEKSFVTAVNAARKRKEHKDRLDKLRAQEALANKNKNKKRKRK